MNLDKILDEAIRLDASDVHLICDNKPMLRINRELLPVEDTEILTPEDMSEIYEIDVLEKSKGFYIISLKCCWLLKEIMLLI